MGRYQQIFEEALARIRQQQGPPPGTFSPAALGYAVPDGDLPDFLPPSTGPVDATWEQNGLSGWGQAPAGMFGVPGPGDPGFFRDLGVTSQTPSTYGSSAPDVSSFMRAFRDAPLSVVGRGAAGGSASAVAAPSPPPNPPMPGSSAVGTRDTVMRWLPQVQQMASKYGVPAELVLAIMHNESGGDPKAQSGYNPGQGYAKGLLQVMPFHFAAGEDPFDPMTNLDKGVKFLGAMYKQYGNDPHKAMAAYFGGPGAIDANGNIKRGIGDINITIGDYLDKKLTPALGAYSRALMSAPSQTVSAAVAPAAATPQAAQGLQAAAIAEASKHIGMPYLLAGQANNPKAGAFDCSGLVQWSFGQAGRALPRVAQDQYNSTQRINGADAQPGDLVFFSGTYDAGTPVTHVGIYLGGNKMLQAGSSGVGYADLSTPYWKGKLYGWGRVV